MPDAPPRTRKRRTRKKADLGFDPVKVLYSLPMPVCKRLMEVLLKDDDGSANISTT